MGEAERGALRMAMSATNGGNGGMRGLMDDEDDDELATPLFILAAGVVMSSLSESLVWMILYATETNAGTPTPVFPTTTSVSGTSTKTSLTEAASYLNPVLTSRDRYRHDHAPSWRHLLHKVLRSWRMFDGSATNKGRSPVRARGRESSYVGFTDTSNR